jgi:hypothetical protein
MSSLSPGDHRMHYQDNSHRWVAPHGVDQRSWEAEVRAHLDEHRRLMGGSRQE